jgi:hypothetical protein
MSDFYIDLSGDLVVNGSGDIATVQDQSTKDIQHVYMRLMTEPGDFFVYPQLGTQLSMLYGMPQNPQTGDLGKRVIRAALEREGVFKNRQITIEAVPVSADSIRFDVYLAGSNYQPVVLSITQDLGA